MLGRVGTVRENNAYQALNNALQTLTDRKLLLFTLAFFKLLPPTHKC